MFENHKLLQYYKQEIDYLNSAGKQFAKKYPQLASSLDIDINQYGDPHLKKLIESFAFLTGRLHHKIDKQFDQISQQLIQLLFPYLGYDTPPMNILHFSANNLPKTSDIHIPKHTQLHHNTSGHKIILQTSSSIQLTNTKIQQANLDLGSSYNLNKHSLLKLQLSNIDTASLKLFINAPYDESMQIFRLLFEEQAQVYLSTTQGLIATNVKIKPAHLREQNPLFQLAPYINANLSHIYNFFAFYQHYLFFELENLDSLPNSENTSLIITLSDHTSTANLTIKPDMLLTNCTTAVNLFNTDANPILLTHTSSKYQVTPKHTDLTIHSIDSVSGYQANKKDTTPYSSFLETDQSKQHWICNKQEDQFLLSIHKPAIDFNEATTETLLIKAKCYNNNTAYIKQNSEWILKEPIRGLTCKNLYKFSKPVESISSQYYPQLLKLLHTQHLSEITQHETHKLLKQLIQLHAHINTQHVNILNYITHIKHTTDVIYNPIGQLLCPTPRMLFEIQLQNMAPNQAFMFASIIGETFKNLSPINLAVDYKITQS